MINIKPKIEFISEAIHELTPACQFSVIGDSLEVDSNGKLKCVVWDMNNSLEEPDADLVISKIDEIKSRWGNLEYQRLRSQEYPQVTDQLDALFKAGLFPEDMAAKIQAVKDKYPKGNV